MYRPGARSCISKKFYVHAKLPLATSNNSVRLSSEQSQHLNALDENQWLCEYKEAGDVQSNS